MRRRPLGESTCSQREKAVVLFRSFNHSPPVSYGVARGPFLGPGAQDSYLVDSASSHMLVSKIKPCMSKYKQSIR